MAKVLIYTGPMCPYCERAKALLKKKEVTYEEVNLGESPEKRDEMIEKAQGRTSVPQIFIGDQSIGGFDDLHALEMAGELDKLLGK